MTKILRSSMIVMMVVACFLNGQAQETKVLTSNGIWPVPDHVYSLQIECWGAGGAGGFAYCTNANLQPTAGGGGGAYAKSTFEVTPGSTIQVYVGKGGTVSGSNTSPTVTDGGNSWVVYGGNTKVLAAGGKTPAGYNNRTGAAGGAASDCIGDVKYSGGKGGNGDYGSTGGYCAAGGGGGAAGTGSNGGDGGDAVAGITGHAGAAGVAASGNPNSGNGGAGIRSRITGSWSGNGNAGSTYGGGGGGCISQYHLFGDKHAIGGAGANGYVLITYYICDVEAGTIVEDKWVCTATDTTIILNNVTAGTPAGGAYAWETSTDGTSWSAISAANAAQYTVVNTTGMFRRSYTTEHCPSFYSNTVTVTRPSDIDPGTVAVEGSSDLTFKVCKGSDFSKNLTAGTTEYDVVWQTSTDRETWTDVVDASPLTLTNVTQDTYVRYLAMYTTTCFVPSNNIITIKAVNNPVVSSFTTPIDLCPGLESYTVTANISADADITTYTWQDVTSNDNEEATINASAPACNHTYTYSLQVTDENGCVSAVKPGSFTTKNPTEITVASNVEAAAAASSSCTYTIPDLTTAVNEALTSECAVTVTSQTPVVGTTVAPESETNVTVNVEDACGNTLAVTVKVTAPAVAILRTDAVEFNADDITVTLWYGACDTLLDIPTPTYTLSVDGYDEQIVLTNNRSSLNSGAILGRVAPGTHVIVWKLSDPCGNFVPFSQNVIVNYPACGEGVTVNDADGNTYQTVRVGCECWTKSNLKSTKYSDGSEVAFDSLYTATDIPAVDEELFGKLYTWYSAMNVAEGDNSATPTVLTADGSGFPYVQGVCPEGWALPTASAYQQISTNANALKSTAAEAWLPGSSATDATGFSATGAGYYDSFAGRFVNLKGETYYWSAETTSVVNGTCCVLTHTCPQGIITDKVKGQGFSVRCVKRSNE